MPSVSGLSAGGRRGLRSAEGSACGWYSKTSGATSAERGRASFLKERSIGHLDPGAHSSRLMIEAVCDVLEELG